MSTVQKWKKEWHFVFLCIFSVIFSLSFLFETFSIDLKQRSNWENRHFNITTILTCSPFISPHTRVASSSSSHWPLCSSIRIYALAVFNIMTNRSFFSIGLSYLSYSSYSITSDVCIRYILGSINMVWIGQKMHNKRTELQWPITFLAHVNATENDAQCEREYTKKGRK